jgi:cation diffusion facilitator CzcD-associated flavoprotein CzcO
VALLLKIVAADVVVIGAGPAGLAVASSLHRRRIPYTVLERSTSIGSSWQSRYDRLRLHTVRWLSGLPHSSIPRSYGRWVARDDFVRYLRDYARRFDIRPEFGVDIRRIDRVDGGWQLQTSAGERTAGAVVVATGYTNVPITPVWPGASTFTGELLHSNEYREPTAYSGQRVLVVGAGNSAAEIAVQLADCKVEVALSVRTPPNIVRRDTLGVPSQLFGIALRRFPEPAINTVLRLLRRISVPDLSGYGLHAPANDGYSQFLRTGTVPVLDHGFVKSVRERRISIVTAIDHFDGDRVVLTDGSLWRPDTIICATGFRPGLDDMLGHLGVLDASGVPRVHGADALPQAPGLCFVGIDVRLAGLLRDIGIEARGVGQALAEQAPERRSG